MKFGPNITPKEPVKQVVVLLHGYGANGADLLDIGRLWSAHLPNTAFYSPNAFEECEENPFGGYQWFGLPDFDILIMRKGLNKAQPKLQDFLKEILIKHNILWNDLYLVGFSQGGIMALDCLFQGNNLGGVVSYSGAFYPPENITKKHSILTPTLLVHGMMDMVVPYTMFTLAQSQLNEYGIKTETLSRPQLAHSIDEAGMAAGLKFIQNNIQTAYSVIAL